MDNPIRLHWLDPRNPRQPFPDPALAMRDPNGLLAIGGDLSAERLGRAYSLGIFPWYNPDEPILWWCPNPRAVLQPSRFHVSRSLRRRLRAADHALTMDRAFTDVLEACAEPRRPGQGTWLGPEMRTAYAELHRRGLAHSIECWRHGRLVGGLYGVGIGRLFFGESMFSREPDASKIVMYHLCRQLAAWDFAVMDCQVPSAHLAVLGAEEWPRTRFLECVRRHRDAPAPPGGWRFGVDVPCAADHRR